MGYARASIQDLDWLGGPQLNDHHLGRGSNEETEELSVNRAPDVKPIWLNDAIEDARANDDAPVEDPAIARWRAELAARRLAGISDSEVTPLNQALKRRRRHRFRPRLFVLVAFGVAAALLVDLAYAGLALRGRLSSASSSLSQGREAINEPDYEAADRNFRTALDNSQDAAALEGHPGWRALRGLPVFSDDTETVSVLASVAELASRVGLDVIDLYERLGATRTGLPGALFDDGRVRLDQVALASRAVSPLLESLTEGANLVHRDLQPRLESLDKALSVVRGDLSQAGETLRRAQTLLAASPSLFGQDSRREYLLLIQNSSTARATGGLVEYHAILSATDGGLRLGPVLPITSLAATGSGNTWRSVNRSVTFPTVARKVLNRYEAQTERRLDGVIATDSIALEYMSRVTGPVRGEGLDLAISDDNVAQVLMHDVFEYFEGRTGERHQFVADVVRKIWFSVTKGVGDPSMLLTQLARATREQHMKVYVTESSSAKAIDQLGLSGDPTSFGPPLQMIAQNGDANSKVDFFLRRESDTRIALNPDGSASIDVTILIENQAPDSSPSPVLGRGARAGTARLSIDMLLPKGADNLVAEGEPARKVKTVEGRPLITIPQTIGPGVLQEVNVSYHLRAPDGQDSSSFSFLLLPAPLAFPDRASVHVFAPEGFCIDACSRPSPGRWDVTTTLREPLPIQVRLISPGDKD
jgi:hypothetical protein